MTTTADNPATSATATAPPRTGPVPDLDPEPVGGGEQTAGRHVRRVPMLALLAAIPLAWGWGLGWHDIVIAVVFYLISGLGISMGFHRYFTHGSFKAATGLRVALAIAGSLAIEGPVLTWVADHRRHHKYSDREGDPHSPWRFGTDWRALTKGLAFAHMGWMFDEQPHLAGEVLPRPAGRPQDPPGLRALHRAGRYLAAGAGPDRRAVVDVLAGRA